jgi:hypothetical protein
MPTGRATAWVWGESGGGASRRPSTTLIGWVSWWRAAVHGEPRTVCVRPPTSLYCASDRGLPTMRRLGAPDQGAWASGGSSRWTRSSGDQPNILPLDLNFTFNFILYLFHHELIHRACFIVTAWLPIDQTAIIHFSVLKQILLLLGLLCSRNHRLSLKPMSAKCSLTQLVVSLSLADPQAYPLSWYVRDL